MQAHRPTSKHANATEEQTFEYNDEQAITSLFHSANVKIRGPSGHDVILLDVFKSTRLYCHLKRQQLATANCTTGFSGPLCLMRFEWFEKKPLLTELKG